MYPCTYNNLEIIQPLVQELYPVLAPLVAKQRIGLSKFGLELIFPSGTCTKLWVNCT
jgi:hypothetical protein